MLNINTKTINLSRIVSLTIFFIFSTAIFSYSQEADGLLKAASRTDKSKASIGQRLFHITTIISGNEIEVFPDELNVSGNFDVKGPNISIKKQFNKYYARICYELIPYDTGKQVIPGIDITCIPAGGKARTIKSNAVTVDVESVFLTAKIEADIKPIAPPISVRRPYFFYAVLSVPLLILIIYIVNILRRIIQKKQEEKKQVLSNLPLLYNKMSESYNAFSSKPAPDKNDFAGLSSRIKEYIECRFSFHAVGLTTQEFLRRIKKHDDFYTRYGENLNCVLRISDMVKFAGYAPKEDDYEKARMLAKDIIKNLSPHRMQGLKK
jgi:hypothetical protein